MALSGLISELSLPIVLQIIEQVKKTGRLTVKKTHLTEHDSSFHIWFIRGKIVAAADRLDSHGLLSLIQEQGWVSIRAAARITDVCANNKPAGSCLKNQGLLDDHKLKMLFRQQVLEPVHQLLGLQDGIFHFESTGYLPHLEMTGLTASPHEILLMAEHKYLTSHKISISLDHQVAA